LILLLAAFVVALVPPYQIFGQKDQLTPGRFGMYASSNGQPSPNTADFDWFEYVEQDEN
jgi:hypothetical protein